MSSPNVHMPSRYRLWTTGLTSSECYDGLADPVQLDSDLTSVDTSAPDWALYASAGALNDMVLHNGVPWVVYIDVSDSSEAFGPFVKYWNGAAWIDAGFPGDWGDAGLPNALTRPYGCSIVSDGASIYVGFEAMAQDCLVLEGQSAGGGCNCLPVDCSGGTHIVERHAWPWISHAPSVWKFDGANWTLAGFWGPLETELCAGQGFFDYFVGCSLGFRANTQWDELGYPTPGCSVLANVGGGGPRLLLAAKDDDFIAVWWQVYDDITVDQTVIAAGDPPECDIGESTTFDTGLSWLGSLNSDGSRTDHGAFDPGNGGIPFDIVWDDGSGGPLYLHYTGGTGQELQVRDATDGTVLQSQASSFGERFSVSFSGLRYISGTDGSGDASVWQLPDDASGPLDDLDGDAAYTPVNPSNAIGKPHPEVNNIWLPNEATMFVTQFDRQCAGLVPPKRWRSLGARVPPLSGSEAGSSLDYESYRSQASSNFLYVAVLNEKFVGDPKHQVWQIPILRCSEVCETPVGTQFINLTIRIDAVEYGPFDISPDAITEFTSIRAGAIGSSAGNLHYIDDAKVGTAGYGSSNLFSDDFSSGGFSNWTSTVGSGLSVVSQEMEVSNAGTTAYASKLLSMTGNHIYCQFKMRITQAEIDDAGGFSDSAEFFNIRYSGGSYEGIAAAYSTLSWFDELVFISGVGAVVAEDVYTIDFFFEWG